LGGLRELLGMAIGKSIRIYDLARELKQDTKRVMEDLRREGADVSVASNSVTFEIAEKVRNKYFPKTEAAPKRGIKVIKAAKVVHEAPEELPAVEEAAPVPEPVAEPKAVPTAEPVTAEEAPVTPSVKRLTRKPKEEEQPQVEAEPAAKPKRVIKAKPVEAEPQVEEAAPPVEAEEEVPAAVEEVPVVEPAVEPVPRSGTRVKQMVLTRDAINKGIKPGERVVAEAPTRTGSLIPERPRVQVDERGRRVEFKGTRRDRGPTAYIYSAGRQSPQARTLRRPKG